MSTIGRSPMTNTLQSEISTLILTKTLVPHRRSGFIQRDNLLYRLSHDEDRPLVIVCAPAGYGKTTALAQWARDDAQRSFAWLSLSSADNDPITFWRYVFAAIRRTTPGLAEDAWVKLHGASPDLDGAVIPGLLNALLEVTGRLVLVLDDYHVIDDPTVHASIGFLIAHLPRSTRLVLATRAVPPLALSSLMTRGHILELGREDLAFDEPETTEALASIAPVSAEDAAEVFSRTEGWPVGVYLTGQDLHRTGAEARAYSLWGTQSIEQYVADEILSELPIQDRNFLIRTSILDELNGELCDRVTGESGSGARLIEATRSNLLVSPIDAKGEWIRIHSVLRDALLRILDSDDRFDVIALHRRAQGWYVDNGFASKAIDHAITAGDHQFAAELIWVHWFGYWATGRLETARRWVEALPEPVICGYPPLLVVAGMISGFSGDGAATRRYAEVAVNAEFDGPVPEGSLSYSSVLTILRANAGAAGVTESRRLAEAAYEREARGSPSARLLAILVGSSRIATGDYDGGRAVLEEEVIGAGPPDAASAYAAGQLALLDVLRGRWIQAAERAAATIQLMRDGGFDNEVTSGAAYVAAAVTAARAGHVADAKRHLRAINAMKHAISTGAPFDGFEIHTFAAETQLLLGDVVAARSHAQHAADYLDILGDGGVFAARLDAVIAQIAEQLVDGQPAPDEGPKSLTVRERQILHLLQSELTLREIGHELYISRNTVKTHTSHIYKKLGVSSREELRRARELDLI